MIIKEDYMTETALSKKVLTLEIELKIIESQLKELASKMKKKKDNKFANLYGIWEKFGDFSYDEIKESEIKFPLKL
jgi:hypothetical protein